MMHTATLVAPQESPLSCGRVGAPPLAPWQSLLLPASPSPSAAAATAPAPPASQTDAPGLPPLPVAGLAPQPATAPQLSSDAVGPGQQQHSLPAASCPPEREARGGESPQGAGSGPLPWAPQAAGGGPPEGVWPRAQGAEREDGDEQLRALETKLELLSIQRQLSSMRCRAFLEELEGYQAAATRQAYRQRSLEESSSGSGRRRRRRRIRRSISNMPIPPTALSPLGPDLTSRASTTPLEDMASEEIRRWRSNSCRR